MMPDEWLVAFTVAVATICGVVVFLAAGGYL
jgi:hypothetical protein